MNTINKGGEGEDILHTQEKGRGRKQEQARRFLNKTSSEPQSCCLRNWNAITCYPQTLRGRNDTITE